MEVSSSPFYAFAARTLTGEEITLSQYAGKTVLVVNTASKCGFTKQYAGLEELYKKYADQGLVILGFPCNQFGGQEPGTSEDIGAFCTQNYGVTFPMFEKIKVRGPEIHPLFKWLIEELPGTVGKAVKWNFTKFLLDKNGKPIDRFAPVTTPESLEADVRRVLGLDP